MLDLNGASSYNLKQINLAIMVKRTISLNYTPRNIPQKEVPGHFASRLGKNRKFVTAFIVLVIAFAYFGYTAFSSATAYYMTVDEVMTMEERSDGQVFQIKGRLVQESFNRSNGGILSTFQLQENGFVLEAIYEGILPDLFFNEHSEIVLLGEFGPEEQFLVHQVLVKCPSKYQSSTGDPN